MAAAAETMATREGSDAEQLSFMIDDIFLQVSVLQEQLSVLTTLITFTHHNL